MENTIRSRETAGFTVPALAAPIAPAVAFLISCFVGFYNGIPAPRPAYTPPDIATYIMDAASAAPPRRGRKRYLYKIIGKRLFRIKEKLCLDKMPPE